MPWSSTWSIRTSTIGRSPEIPCRQRADGPSAVAQERLDRGAQAWDRSRGSASRAAGRGAPRRSEIPRWRSWTCACVQARLDTRSNVAGSRYLSASASGALPRVGDDGRELHARRRPGGEAHPAAQAEDRVEHRAGRVRERAPLLDRAGVADARGRARESARGRSRTARCRRSRPAPSSRARPRPAPPVSRGRRLARSASSAGTNSVWTKRFEKAGCAASAAGGREDDLGVGRDLDLARRAFRGS